MVDVFSKEKRSWLMGQVKSVDTAPELVVRSIAHRLGFRFCLHRQDLPGRPDLVFPRLRKVVFVHGCFWHGHNCRRGKRTPSTNKGYWVKKIRSNVRRNRQQRAELRRAGWDSLVIWECQIKKPDELIARLFVFLAGE